MTPFILKQVPVQNLICFWALLLCLGTIADAVLLWRQKRAGLFGCALLCFAAAHFMLQLCREGTQLRLGGHTAALPQEILTLPFAAFAAVMTLLTAAAALMYANIRRWSMSHISSASIKESLDSLPAGICYYTEDGRCILVNHRMNEICRSVLGCALQNGARFYDAVKERQVHALSDGTAVSFRHSMISYRGTQLHELIASDITELYEKGEKLRRDNEKARQHAANMKIYGDNIADTVRRQEILQAKVSIHDEMNRMILATKRSVEAESSGEERRAILQMWQGQVLLLCREAGTSSSTNVVSDLNALADAIGMRIEWDRVPGTESPQALALFLAAAREALANAAKHAGAERLFIRIREKGGMLCADFTNDGRQPSGPVTESGGLRELRRRLEAAGGSMRAGAEEGFRLSVIIPEGGQDTCLTEY